MQISQCCASTVTHHYSKGFRGGCLLEEVSQLEWYNCGNVIVLPQDSTWLPTVLPPTIYEMWDAMYVVSKWWVGSLITFLMNQNKRYQDHELQFNQSNLDLIFGEDATKDDKGIYLLKLVEIMHLPNETESNNTFWKDATENLVMESVSYTSSDQTTQSRELMKAHALAFALDRRALLASHSA